MTSLAFLPGGILASAGHFDFKLWDVSTGTWLRTLIPKKNAIYLAPLPNGVLASGSNGGSIQLWNPTTGSCLYTHSADISCFTVSPNGVLVGGSYDGTIKLWRQVVNSIHSIPSFSNPSIPNHVQTQKTTQINLTTSLTYPPIVMNPPSSQKPAITQSTQQTSPTTQSPITLSIVETSTVSLQKIGTLSNFVGSLSILFGGDPNYVICFASFPDGSLANGYQDGTIKLWNPATQKCLWTVDKGHTKRVTALAVLPNGTPISGSHDGTIKLWNASNGACLRTINVEIPIDTLVLLSDGISVAAGWQDAASNSLITIWDISTGRRAHTLNCGSLNRVYALAVCENGTLVAGCSYESMLWNPATGNRLRSFSVPNNSLGSMSALAVFPNGILAFGYSDGTIRLWSSFTGECLHTCTGHTAMVRSLVALPSGALISGSDDNTIKVWNPLTGACLHTCIGHAETVRSLAVLRDGTFASGSKAIHLWKAVVSPCLPLREIKTLTSAPAKHLVAFPNGILASCKVQKSILSNNCIYLWNLSQNTPLKTFSDSDLISLLALKDGFLVCGRSGGATLGTDFSSLKFLDPFKGEILSSKYASFSQSSWITYLAVLSDGTVVGSSDICIFLWGSGENPRRTLTVPDHARITALIVLPDDTVVCGSSNTIKTWNPSTGACLRTFGNSEWVDAFAVLLDGTLVTGSLVGPIKTWNPSTGVCLLTFDDSKGVTTLAVLQEGTLVSGSDTGTVKFWNPATGVCLHTLTFSSKVISLAVMPDGTLAIGFDNDSIKFFK